MSAEHLYLFRYRNLLTDDTLGEHRKLITQHGYCWWGWWQRPAEDVRKDLWEELNRRAQPSSPVRIALFDSEPGREGPVHFAKVDAVILPVDGRSPPLPEAELSKVPGYYREAPFSSAWMRLVEIDPEPIDHFFRSYSFARAPRLPRIRPSDCERYVDKLILDADELRSMDTTVWEVRPKRDGDRDERILAASTTVIEALSHQPVELRSSRILHLSDLHFTTPSFMRGEHNWDLIGEGETTLHARIGQALKSRDSDPPVGLIIISGDLTYRASSDEFYEAFRFVHALLGALHLGPDHLVVVPGNHDLAWTKTTDTRWQPDQKVTEAPEAAQKTYRDAFYQRVFRHSAAPKLGMARRFVCPNGVTLEVGGLNSSGLEQGRGWLAGMGRLADGAFTEVAGALGWRPQQEDSLALRVLVHHHHLTVTEDVLPTDEFERGFGMAADAKRTLREAARHGVQLVLHGHRHQPFIGAEQIYAELETSETTWALGRVAFIGSGSAGSTSVRDHANFFNVIDVHPSKLDLTMFRANSPHGSRGDFRQVHRWSAPVRTEAGRLQLGDWERGG